MDGRRWIDIQRRIRPRPYGQRPSQTNIPETPTDSEIPPEEVDQRVSEYLEKILSDAYKREIDQEENVVRSLPFVAATLAVLFTIISLSRESIPKYTNSYYENFIYALLILLIAAVSLIIWYLLIAVRPRRFEYLMSEKDLKQYADDLRHYYSQIHTRASDIEQKLMVDLRQTMVDQYSVGAMNNRANNVSRARARARSFTSLVVALGLAFMLLVTISVHEALKGKPGGTDSTRSEQTQRKTAAETGAAADAAHH
jgi:hypothetical protein